MADCKLRRPDGGVTNHPFAQGPATFGRGSAANLRIDDEFISRIHCEVFLRGEQSVIRDLNSRNGTFVNGQRIQEQVLANGDKLQIGETQLTFQANMEMVPPKLPGELPRHEISAVFRIVPKEPVRQAAASTVLIPHAGTPSLATTNLPKT